MTNKFSRPLVSTIMRRLPFRARRFVIRFVAARTESCLRITRKMSLSMETGPSLKDRFDVWFHCLVCDACILYLVQIRSMRSAFRGSAIQLADDDGLDKAAKERLTRALRTAGSGN